MRSILGISVLALLAATIATSCRENAPDNPRAAGYAAADDALRARFASGTMHLPGNDVPVTAGAAPGYVSDQMCAECHEEIAESYHDVGMSRAFMVPGPETVIEDFDAKPYHHAASDRYYEVRRRRTDYVVRRYQVDDDGLRYNELEETVDFIMGSGSNVRSYLYQTEIGEIYELPIAWYPRDRKWAMPPGYEEGNHEGFLRPIMRDCMFCHNAYPDMPAGSDHMGQPQRFPSELPSGLGCQRCHGPGAQHVEVAYDWQATDEQLSASIVNPGRLEPRLRDDVCLQCHLQPDSEIVSVVRREGRGDFSYRPGQPLVDYLTPVDHSVDQGQSDRFQINHHPYRLFQSRCYVESARQGNEQLSCLTCHDPHAKIPAEQRAAHYRAACLGCHQLDQCDIASMQMSSDVAEGDVDCIGCHMVRRRTQDVIEVVMTDHRIGIHASDEDPIARLDGYRPDQPEDFVPYWRDRAHPEELQMALAQCAAGSAAALETLEDAIDDVAPDAVDAKLALAAGLWNHDQIDEAMVLFEEVSEAEPTLARAHEMFGRCMLRQGELDRGLAALTRAWELDRQSASTAYGLGLALTELGRDDEALARFVEATELRPNYPGAHLNVGHLRRKNRDYTGAIEAYAQVHRIDPLREDAYYLHGLTRLARNDTRGAVRIWRRGLRAASTSARLHQALAIGFLMDGKFREAADPAGRARTLGADRVNCDLVDALMHVQAGDPDAARASYEKAAGGLEGESPTPALRALLVQLAQRQLGR